MPTSPDLDDLLWEAIAAAGPALSEDVDATSHLELIARTARAHARTGTMLDASVRAARSAGHSWESVGETLGITRQAAQQRFGRPAVPALEAADHAGHAGRRIVRGLTAFNEMAALDRAGRHGWHSVDYGPLFHVLERDDRQWRHRRVPAWARRRAALEERGWRLVGGGWFPWEYYAKPSDDPALPGDPSDEQLRGS